MRILLPGGAAGEMAGCIWTLRKASVLAEAQHLIVNEREKSLL